MSHLSSKNLAPDQVVIGFKNLLSVENFKFNAVEKEAETFVQAEEGDWDNWQVPPSFSLSLSFWSQEAEMAAAFIAQFPKFVRISKGEGSSSSSSRFTTVQFSLGYTWKPADKKNETGRKRFNRFVKVMTQEWA